MEASHLSRNGSALKPTGWVRHHIPGRTRLETSARLTAELQAALEREFAEHGWTLVSVSPKTGAVLVRHGPERAVAEVLDAFLGAVARDAGSDQARNVPPDPDPRAASVDPQLARVMTSPAEAVLELLGSGAEGLSKAEAALRLAAHGANAAPAVHRRSRAELLSGQLKTLPVALLAGSAVLSLATGGVFDAIVTVSVVALNAGIGFFTENSVEALIARLGQPVEHTATIIRGGETAIAPAREIVPGDLLVLAPGQSVSADARVLEAVDLTVDESTLTGESLGVEKTATALADENAPLAERRNMLHAGTVVVGGQGLAIAVRTGSKTEAALIRALISTTRPPKPVIEEKLAELSRTLAIAALAGSGVILAIGIALRHPWVATVRSAVSVAVASIPEGMPAVATTTFALEAREMERRGVFVRMLPAIESIGAIDTLCLDKTGTLTENRMAVAGAAAGSGLYSTNGGDRLLREDGLKAQEKDRRALAALAEAVCLCNTAEPEPDAVGSGTELALLRFAEIAGVDIEAARAAAPRAATRERSEHRRYMSTLHERNGERLLFLKGAPEDVLALCAYERRTIGRVPLTESRRGQILEQDHLLASRGQRVLGVARRRGREGAFDTASPDQLEWLGLVGLSDPLRPRARQAVETFHAAGVRTLMITGDQAVTAHAVAESLDLSGGRPLEVLTGAEIAEMDDEQLQERAAAVTVFARATPADKLRIVRALQSGGAVVGALGDGVNDGPALREARLGIAMGKRGSDVARDVADVVIAEDDLMALARAVARGRATDDNIRNAVRFLLSTNMSEILVMLVEAFGPAAEQETPLELFWINLVTDVLPAIGLAVAEPAGDVMERPPSAQQGPILTGSDYRTLAIDGAQLSATSLIAHFAMRMGGSPAAERSITFLTLAGTQLAHAFALRDRSPNDPRSRAKSVSRLEAAVVAAGALLSLPFTIAPLRSALGMARVSPGQLALSTALIGGSMLVSEARRGGAQARPRGVAAQP